MKAQVIQADKTIQIKEKPVPTVANDEVLVRVTTVALNPTDWKHVQYMTVPGAICGCELVGEVVQVGESVTGFSVGDIISGANHGSTYQNKGAFAEYAVVLEDLAWKVPDNVKPEEAVGMNVGLLTAMQSFYNTKYLAIPTPPAKIEGNQWILIYGGSSSVGLYAIQLAKISGFKVVTTASPRNFDLLASLGADVVFDYRNPEVVDKIKAVTGNTIHLALDTISSLDSQTLTINSLAPGPGKLQLMMPPVDTISKLRQDITIAMSNLYTVSGIAFKIADWDVPAQPEDREQVREWLTGPGIQFVKDGLVKPNPVKLMPGGLAGIPEGLEYMKAGKNSAEKLVYKI
ncbi:zinc-binding oxidoreductase ToxD [Irpex rosettiformis]|uniref:Zinc-binding oxidoreductase ToxD n=1 Tax=Irpex rosettiformis TaxID=378272 RepID=A0ACB8UGS6_9APHY|nr:zinc-binding oxidoreductase ToxD [Irpex rosettiformis]